MARSPLVIADEFIEKYGLTRKCKKFVERNINAYGSSYHCRVGFIIGQGLYPAYEAYEKECQAKDDNDFRKKQFIKPSIDGRNPFFYIWKYVEKKWDPEKTFYDVGENVQEFLRHFNIPSGVSDLEKMRWLKDIIERYEIQGDGDYPEARSILFFEDVNRYVYLHWDVDEEDPEDVSKWKNFHLSISVNY